MPFFASAADAQPIDRRHAFLLVWRSIQRPALDTRETAFTDVAKGSEGFMEITYAKARGILDDDDPAFYPDLPLRLDSALVWLFRTRSIGDVEDITKENMVDFLIRYPIANYEGHDRDTLTEEQLLTLMRSLDAKLETEEHEVSLYSEKFHGKGTAFGEAFDMNALTAAHKYFPANTLVEVTNKENGKKVTVRINDRGPYVDGRDMDLSLGAFTTIAPRSQGVLHHVTFKRLGDAATVLGCGVEPQYQRRITKNVRLDPGVPWSLALGQSVSWESSEPYVLLRQTYPDGGSVRLQNWMFPDETFTFEPSIPGTYKFLVGTKEGRRRELQMTVNDCTLP